MSSKQGPPTNVPASKLHEAPGVIPAKTATASVVKGRVIYKDSKGNSIATSGSPKAIDDVYYAAGR